MKTALTELIEWMEQNQYFIGNDLYAKQKELLEKEKEQIEKAYLSGDMEYDKVEKPTVRAKEYYNETFRQ